MHLVVGKADFAEDSCVFERFKFKIAASEFLEQLELLDLLVVVALLFKDPPVVLLWPVLKSIMRVTVRSC